MRNVVLRRSNGKITNQQTGCTFGTLNVVENSKIVINKFRYGDQEQDLSLEINNKYLNYTLRVHK